MAEVITVIGWALVGTGGVSTGTIISTVAIAALQVAGTVYSVSYQRSQQKKARAAAARLRREQQRRAAEMKNRLAKLGKLGSSGFHPGTFDSASGPRDITTMVRRSTASRRMIYGRARVGGIWFYAETSGTSNETLHLVLGLCEGPIDAIEKVYFDDEEITLDGVGNGTGKWAGFVTVGKHLGNPGDPADGYFNSFSSRWTTDHKLEGIAYLTVSIRVNLELFSAIPEISAVVRGKNDIYDPRTETTGYSTNPALCLNNYLTTQLIGPGIDPADIDQAALIQAANVCDEEADTLTGSEPRYACQGAIDLSTTVEDNASLFIQAMNGDLIQNGGQFTIQAGEYVPPTFTIDMDMLAGAIEFSSLQPRKERANVVKGTFLSETNSWQKFDFPSIRDAAAITQDGQEVVSDLSLELVGSGTQAQRLAGMELKQARRGRSVQLVCNLKAMPARVGANVILNIPRYFDNDVYRVVESKFSLGNDGAPTYSLTLLESDAAIYEWSLGDEKLINVPPALNAKSPQTGVPVFSPLPEEDTVYPIDVTITSLTAGAVIRYAINGTPPETADAGLPYEGPIAIEEGDILAARAFRAGYLASALELQIYL